MTFQLFRAMYHHRLQNGDDISELIEHPTWLTGEDIVHNEEGTFAPAAIINPETGKAEESGRSQYLNLGMVRFRPIVSLS
jgi:hypothetical protein